jgi:hypothetical protein
VGAGMKRYCRDPACVSVKCPHARLTLAITCEAHIHDARAIVDDLQPQRLVWFIALFDSPKRPSFRRE